MSQQSVVEFIRRNAKRVSDLSDFDELIGAIGDAKYVLLGESTHGTSEFYEWRAELSKRLILEHGFSFVAVEGDWPPCFEVNRYIKGEASSQMTAENVLKGFDRWPTWMWANEEIQDFIEWLESYNHQRGEHESLRKVGFYGLDIYSLWESMDEIIQHLEAKRAPELEDVKKLFSCFNAYGRDPQTYGLSAQYMSEDCRQEVVDALMKIQEKRNRSRADHEADLALEVNAMVAVDAERYYTAMFQFGEESWNIRDVHMVDTLEKIMAFYPPDAKCIVWEHNTHIGDARYTDMPEDGMVNVGQLLRERHGDEVFAVGFGTHHGTVIAGHKWGGPMQVMTVSAAQAGSWEDLMHSAGECDRVMVFRNRVTQDSPLQGFIDQRAIGVVYDPSDERGNYVPTVLPRRYDAFVFVDESHAVLPLDRIGAPIVTVETSYGSEE